MFFSFSIKIWYIPLLQFYPQAVMIDVPKANFYNILIFIILSKYYSLIFINIIYLTEVAENDSHKNCKNAIDYF